MNNPTTCKVCSDVDALIGPWRPTNDHYHEPRSALADSNLWRALTHKHNLSTDDFDWLCDHAIATRDMLQNVKGFNSRSRIIANQKMLLLKRFNADDRTMAVEWRSTMEPTLQGAMEHQHGDERVEDILHMATIIDSLI